MITESGGRRVSLGEHTFEEIHAENEVSVRGTIHTDCVKIEE